MTSAAIIYIMHMANNDNLAEALSHASVKDCYALAAILIGCSVITWLVSQYFIKRKEPEYNAYTEYKKISCRRFVFSFYLHRIPYRNILPHCDYSHEAPAIGSHIWRIWSLTWLWFEWEYRHKAAKPGFVTRQPRRTLEDAI